MSYRDFCKMSRAAQYAHAKARRITELQLIKRELEWKRLLRRVYWRGVAALLWSLRRDALILTAIFAGDLVALHLLVRWIVNWR